MANLPSLHLWRKSCNKRALEASSSTIEEQTPQGKRLGPCVQSQSEQRGKVRVLVSRAVTDKRRDAIFPFKFLYHELGNYFIKNKSEWNIRRMKLTSERNLRKSSKTQSEAASITKKNSKDFNVVNFLSLCDFVYGCHNDRMKVYGRWFCSCLLSQ